MSELVYGSLGSSSSQIFVPRKLSEDDFLDKFPEKCKIVNINIDRTEWSIILVPDNIVGGNYIPFEILQHIYSKVKLPIAISNSVSHSFYSKDQCFKMLEKSGKSNKFSATLYELKEDLRKEDLQKGDSNVIRVNSKDGTEEIRKASLVVYKTLKNIEDDDFLKNVVVIPRFSTITISDYEEVGLTYNNTTIQNGWTSVLQLKTETSEYPSETFMFADIGGGKTNSFYKDNNVGKLIESVLGELGIKREIIDTTIKSDIKKAAGLTGKIRADLESDIGDGDSTCSIIKSCNDIICDEKYKKYFAYSLNILSYALLPSVLSEGSPSVPTQESPPVPLQGGKKTRKLHKRNLKKRKSKKRKCKKTNRIVRRKRKRTKK